MNEQTLARLALFLRDLGQALHVSGAPAHDLETAMKAIGQRLGARVEGFAVLTFLALTVVAGGNSRRVELLRLPPYDYNMARLIELDALCREISSVDDLECYIERLAAIMRQPAPWSGWRFVGMGFLLSGSVALLLRGGWVEMLCGGLLGMFFVAGYLQFARIPRLGPAVPVILCALAAMGAQGLAHLWPQQVPFISAVAGIVLLLPGFMLTVAMSELATQNYLAGTGRLTGAFVLLFLMGAGLAIGTQISLAWLPAVPLPESVAALPAWAIWAAIAALGISLLAVLQAPWSAVHVSVGACLLAWAVYSLVNAKMGNVVGAFAGALAVASAGHLYQYLSKRPAALVQIPGLITLVPGSMGFRGVHALIQQDSAAGISLITDMVITGAVLAVGLLLADNILPLVFERRGASDRAV
ncbi:threonine/serine exporter family protein [Dechloromonas hortensis]|uniref:threonine/serine exporter family protein n=1 Tax=Dechloromonas hortensis TaxID=337779 RepID=UPI001291A4FC|nr:threonine/serine exporter family protein [Dechloromonas hortensis]